MAADREPVPGEEGDVGQPHQAGHQADRAVRSRDEPEIVLSEKRMNEVREPAG